MVTLTFEQKYRLAVLVAGLLFVLGAVQASDPAALGLGPVVVRWLGLLGYLLGAWASFLPRVQKPGQPLPSDLVGH